MSRPHSIGPALPSDYGKESSSRDKSSHDRKKRRRRDSSSSSSSDSDSYSSSSSSDSYRRRKRHKSKRHKHGKSSRSRRPPGAPELTVEDFFRYASEYREWMLSHKGIHSSSLTTDESRAMFGDFVKAWNKGKLSARYYAGIEPTSVASSSRTDHRWTFTGVDSRHLSSIRNEVNSATTAGKSTFVTESLDDELLEPIGPSAAPGPLPPSSSRSSGKGDWAEERERREREHDRVRRDRRDYRKSIRDAEEDMAPRATGRDRVYEKRRENNQARRSYESERLEDKMIDPFDDSERRSALEYEAQQQAAAARRKAAKSEALADRLAAAQAKEDATMASLRQMARDAGHRV